MNEDQEKLYRVTSVANEFPYLRGYFNDVTFKWYVTDRKDPVIPLEQGVKDYGQHQNDPSLPGREALNEFFTAGEAKLLQAYLLKVHNIECRTEEVVLPLAPDTKGYGAQPLGRGANILLLYMDEEYSLPFQVRGLFSVDPEKDVTALILGTLFVKGLLKRLGRDMPEEGQIRKIVAEMKDEGLLVGRCPTREELEEARRQQPPIQGRN